LENTTAEDFQEQPPNFLPLVKNETILKWGGEVNQLWNYLSRLVRLSIKLSRLNERIYNGFV